MNDLDAAYRKELTQIERDAEALAKQLKWLRQYLHPSDDVQRQVDTATEALRGFQLELSSVRDMAFGPQEGLPRAQQALA